MNQIMKYALLFFVGMFFETWIHEAAHALAALTLGLGIDQFIQIPLGPGQVDPTKWGAQPPYIIVLVCVAPYVTYLALGALTIGFHKPAAFPLIGYGLFANFSTGSYVDFGIIQGQIGIYTTTISTSLSFLSLIVIVGWMIDIIGQYIEKEEKESKRRP